MRKGWTISTLGDLCQIKPPKKEARDRLSANDIVSFVPMNDLGVREKGLKATEDRPLESVSGSYTYFADGDVLLAKITPCFENGKLGIAHGLTNGVGFGSSEFVVFRPDDSLDAEYLFYFLSQDSFRDAGASVMSGAVGHKRVPKEFIEECPIPLPPLPEQKRIVAILDEAFTGIAKAVANTEKNLANARELFRRSLAMCFSQSSELPRILTEQPVDVSAEVADELLSDGIFLAAKSSTRGRAETERVIEGELSLSVGMPSNQPRSGWRWTKITDIARLESGHTPSRKNPEYWDGNIPWLGIKDARAHHGGVIEDTQQHTNQLGIDNSAARILPAGTVCLSRTASVGYVVVTKAAMATSQDFVNWVCSSELDPHFLKYLFLSEGREFSRFSSGSVHQTIYFPEVKAFHICHPNVVMQRHIVEFLDEMRVNTENLEAIYQQKLTALADLKQSLLQKAFSGELTADAAGAVDTVKSALA